VWKDSEDDARFLIASVGGPIDPTYAQVILDTLEKAW